jgi:DUF4097 and DUF4098 domain-containing protein YvlB
MHMRPALAKSLAVALGLLMLTTLAVASEQGRFEKTLQVGTGADLEVLTRSGNVTVHAGSTGSISIIGKIHVGDHWFNAGRKADVETIEKNPPISQSGNSVRIDYVNVNNISIDYEITAPSDTRVRTKSGSGDQTVEGMKAGVEVETGSGDVRLRDLAGNLRVHTGSGNVEARGAAGPIEAHAGSGDINIEENSPGDVHIETGSGNIEVRGVDGGLRASAGSGDVRVDGKPTNSWSIKTGSGNADLRVAQEMAFDVDLSTSSGSIVMGQPVTTTIQGRVEDAHKNIRGKVRGGGPEISVHTGSGDIRVD